MNNFATNDPTNCLRVCRVLVYRHTQWLLPCSIDQTSYKTSGCMFVSVFTEHRIKQVSIMIYRSIQVTPTTTDFDNCPVQIPGTTGNSTSFSTKIFSD